MAYDPDNMVPMSHISVEMTRFIGDIHGDFDFYTKAIEASPHPTIQVGDFGVGFKLLHMPDVNAWEAPTEAMKRGDHRFIRGNHDNPAECRKTHGYIPDATFYGRWWCMGGALSIDKDWRIPGFDWWEDEELSTSDLNKVIDIYQTVKPDYVVTHTCPRSIAPKLFNNVLKNQPQFDSRTEQAFDVMWEIHKPKVWVFGHWHQSKAVRIDTTDFVCVGINEYVDIGIPI